MANLIYIGGNPATSGDYGLRVYSYATGSFTLGLSYLQNRLVRSVACTPNAKYVAVCDTVRSSTSDPRVRVFKNSGGGTLVEKANFSVSQIYKVSITADGKFVSAAREGATADVIQRYKNDGTDTYTSVGSTTVGGSNVTSFVLSDTGRRWAAGSSAVTTKIGSLDEDFALTTLTPTGALVIKNPSGAHQIAHALSPDGAYILQAKNSASSESRVQATADFSTWVAEMSAAHNSTDFSIPVAVDPSATYFVLGESATAAKIYKRSGSTYDLLTTPLDTVTSSVTSIKFSRDTAAAHYFVGFDASIQQFLRSSDTWALQATLTLTTLTSTFFDTGIEDSFIEAIAGPVAGFFGPEGLIISTLGDDVAAFEGTAGKVELVAESVIKNELLSFIREVQGPVSDGIELEETMTLEQISTLIERLTMSGVPNSNLEAITSVIESVGMEETLSAIIAVMVAEGMTLDATDTTLRQVIVNSVEGLVSSGVVTSQLQAVSIVAAALTLSEVIDFGQLGLLVESAQMADVVLDQLSAHAALVEALVAQGALDQFLMVTVNLTEGMELDPQLTSQAILTELLNEGMVLDAFVVIDGTVYHGWAVNSETTAASQYLGYNFNSMCKVGELYIGANENGLYLMEGEDDAGDKILMSMLTGKLDFGSDYFKTVRDIVFGYTAEGEIGIKVTTSQNGIETERWYQLSENSTGASREARVKLAKGVKSQYWQFELVNPTGKTFNIDKMRMNVIRLGRRV